MRNVHALTTSIALLAWFILSNHCMLDAAISPSLETVAPDTCCPMHTSEPSSPDKPKEQGGMLLCCKNLPATILKSSPYLAIFIAPPFASFYNQDRILPPGWSERPLLCLDTGPPGAFSFSELVLQRSLPAHAPPSIA